MLYKDGLPILTGISPESQKIRRKLAAILAADVAGYSHLMSADEEQTTRLLRSHRQVMDALIEEFGGRIANTAGDSVLAEFPSSVDAVRCALAIQEALQTKNMQVPKEQWLQFRIGVNSGDVITQDQDLLGDDVNIAARLESIAEPGGICISDDVRNQIEGKLTLSFIPLGAKTLKNIPRPVSAFKITSQTLSDRAKPSFVEWIVSKYQGNFAIVAILVSMMVAVSVWLGSSLPDRPFDKSTNREPPTAGAENEIASARNGKILKTGSFAGHDYHLMSSSGINWIDAENSARAAGGYLVSIGSKEENEFVIDMIRDEDRVWRRRDEGSRWQRFGPWIGLIQRSSSDEPSGNWQWSNDDALTYEGWFDHQPDNYDGVEDFGRFREFSDQEGIKWDDARPNYSALGFIVEFEHKQYNF